MRIARMTPPFAVACALALGAAALSGGCSNYGVPEGGQAPVDHVQQEKIRGGMKNFMDQQAAAKKQAKKVTQKAH